MGAPKQKWTAEEEEALRAGVAKYGTGKWKNIQKDPEFIHCLAARSNIDLKDKWRNLSVSAGQGSRDKFKSPKLKALPAPLVANSNASSLPAAQDATADVAMDPSKSPVGRNLSGSASGQRPRDKFKSPKLKALPAPLVANSNASTSLPAAQDATADVAMGTSESPVDIKTAPRYNELKFEAISTLKDLNGSNTSAINSFIEQRSEVPQNLRELSLTPLRLVNQGELEKVQNSFRIKKDGASGQKMPTTPKLKDNQHLKQLQTPAGRTLEDEIEEATKHTAYLIVDAENKSFLASEAVKEAERFAKMMEDSEAMLVFAKEICERSSCGEVVNMA